MEYLKKTVAEMTTGDRLEGFYILKGVVSKVSSNGKPFLSTSLVDRTGIIDAKVWDYSGPIAAADEGRIVKIRGEVTEYKGNLQLRIDRIRLRMDSDDVDVDALVPTAPIDVEEMWVEIENIVDSMEDKDYKAICRLMLDRYSEAVRIIPAGKSMHHAFRYGLVMHTGNMLKTADFLSGLYCDSVNRDLLLAGTLLHDFSKTEEFELSELGLVTKYSVKGELLGHLVMGAKKVADCAEELNIPENKSVLLQHMILSHHGEPEYGAAVKPMIIESELLSLIDMIDSRMEIYRETMEQVPAGDFSGRVYALDKKIYHHE